MWNFVFEMFIGLVVTLMIEAALVYVIFIKDKKEKK